MGEAGWAVPGADPRAKRAGGPGRGLAAGVVLMGAALAVSPLLPWAGISADVPLIGQNFGTSLHGYEDAAGWFVMAAGVLAAVLGVAGITRGRAFTGFAIVPGAAATLAMAIFLGAPRTQADFSLSIPGLVEVHPQVEYGWFAGIGASILITVLAAGTLFRRR
jgi:hypothetical protein